MIDRRAGRRSAVTDSNGEYVRKGPPLRGGPAETAAFLSTVVLAPVRGPRSAGRAVLG